MTYMYRCLHAVAWDYLNPRLQYRQRSAACERAFALWHFSDQTWEHACALSTDRLASGSTQQGHKGQSLRFMNMCSRVVMRDNEMVVVMVIDRATGGRDVRHKH